jgi:HAD superfamily hydrolase (TIGR01509 family)
MTDHPTAVVFDIDGTLVDSNFLHVDAWNAAFTELGLSVPSWRIQRAIGADSAELLDQLIGDQTDDIQSKASDLHSSHYQELTPRLQLLPGAQDLLRAVTERGSRVVLATSSPQPELDHLLALLDSDDVIYAVTSSEDVEKAKPAPDLIATALSKAGVDSKHAVMIGDAVWDIKAAAAAGVATIALHSGGTGRVELQQAGAVAVYDDARDLLDDLSESPLSRLWHD